ncbi:MAG TPA: DNA primase [Candidatus Brocadiales bacterium]|nr:DNA primase [Candidatus Brocadiales bacterium]
MRKFIPQEQVQEIQRVTDIFHVISEYVHLKHSGKNFIGLCPFHAEKTPSFTVNPDRQFFKCYGCGVGGSVFTFIMKQEGVEFTDAVRLLAERANITINEANTASDKQAQIQKTRLYEANDFAASFFHEFLTRSDAGKHVRDYLSKRKIDAQSINKFKLGYSPDSWDSLLREAAKKGISGETLEKAGLVSLKTGGGYYDRFRNRLMFPIVDARQKVIGFGARALDDSMPKYLNSAETPLFNKSRTLYGIHLAKGPILKHRKAMLMEGYTDVIMAYQHGIDWAIAIMGTSLTREHIKILRQYCDSVILVLDGDTAGLNSSDRNLDIFVEEDLDASIVQLPEGYDPCDFFIKEGAQKFMDYVQKAHDFFGFKMQIATQKWNLNTVSGKAAAIDNVLSTVMKMPDIIKRNLTIKRVAEEMEIDEIDLRKHLKSQSVSGGRTQYSRPQTLVKQDASLLAQKEILGITLLHNETITKVLSEVGLEAFSDERLYKIAEKVFSLYGKRGIVNEKDLISVFVDIESSQLLADIIDRELQDAGNYMLRLEGHIKFLKKRAGKDELRQTRSALGGLQKRHVSDEQLENTLLKEFHEKNKFIRSNVR